VGPLKKGEKVIYITAIRVTKGSQWDRCQIRVPRRVGGTT
jgi:hypothetical protein